LRGVDFHRVKDHELRGAAFKRLLAYGSMVLPIVSVRPGGTRVFALVEGKNRDTKEEKYRSAEGWIADCVSRVKDQEKEYGYFTIWICGA
jgi:hypothetical protein